jgi:hypothetical protein
LSKALTKPDAAPPMDPVKCLAVIDALMNHEAETATELSTKLDIPLKSVMAIMAHPEFVKRFHKIKREVAKAEFDGVAYDRLIKIIRKTEEDEQLTYVDEQGRVKSNKSSADKNAIAAAKALSDILGVSEKKKGPGININLNFDSIIRESSKNGEDDEYVPYPGFED